MEQYDHVRKVRPMRFVFARSNERKNPKQGTRRHQLLELLLQGATFEEVQEKINWTRKQTYEAIRLIHYAHGYGLRQDETGRIFAVGD